MTQRTLPISVPLPPLLTDYINKYRQIIGPLTIKYGRIFVDREGHMIDLFRIGPNDEAKYREVHYQINSPRLSSTVSKEQIEWIDPPEYMFNELRIILNKLHAIFHHRNGIYPMITFKPKHCKPPKHIEVRRSWTDLHSFMKINSTLFQTQFGFKSKIEIVRYYGQLAFTSVERELQALTELTECRKKLPKNPPIFSRLITDKNEVHAYFGNTPNTEDYSQLLEFKLFGLYAHVQEQRRQSPCDKLLLAQNAKGKWNLFFDVSSNLSITGNPN